LKQILRARRSLKVETYHKVTSAYLTRTCGLYVQTKRAVHTVLPSWRTCFTTFLQGGESGRGSKQSFVLIYGKQSSLWRTTQHRTYGIAASAAISRVSLI